MIYEISSSSPTFNRVTFKAGVNIVVADKGTDSSINNSRNGLGKTTLIEIIHFCLGAKFDKNSRLSVPELSDWDFSIDLDVGKARILATRYIKDPNKIFIIIKNGNASLELKTDSDTKAKYITVDSWKKYLGKMLFDMSDEIKSISSRTILGFFVRREDGYEKAFKVYNQEKSSSTVLNNAYVLGLNWQKTSELFDIRYEYDKLDSLRKESESVGENRDLLKSRMVALEADIAIIEQSVREFNVLPEYETVQQEANKLTSEIHKITNQNMFLRRKVEVYKESIKQEIIPDDNKLDILYQEIGIVFGDSVRKNISDARKFH